VLIDELLFNTKLLIAINSVKQFIASEKVSQDLIQFFSRRM